MMLGDWRPHTQYLEFVACALAVESQRNPQSVDDFETSIKKLCAMNLDNVRGDIAYRFSITGRPSNQQPEVFRAAVLMGDQKEASIDKWVKRARATPILCALVGVSPKDFKNIELKKPKTKYGKEKKPPKNPGIIKELADKAMEGEQFAEIPEALLQRIFMEIAVKPSAEAGLIDNPQNLTVCGDGTIIESNANPHGHRTDDPEKRRFADPLAKWLWDSYHERWAYGYTAYILSMHNENLKLDLPLYLRFAQTSSFDGVTFIEALAHFRAISDKLFQIRNVLVDSAHDNYATYGLLHHFNIRPFIALNPRGATDVAPQQLIVTPDGVPVCADGHEMTNWGYEHKKSRIKYRCPIVTGRVEYCPYDANCNKSLYGKIVYLRTLDNLHLCHEFSAPQAATSTHLTFLTI